MAAKRSETDRPLLEVLPLWLRIAKLWFTGEELCCLAVRVRLGSCSAQIDLGAQSGSKASSQARAFGDVLNAGHERWMARGFAAATVALALLVRDTCTCTAEPSAERWACWSAASAEGRQHEQPTGEHQHPRPPMLCLPAPQTTLLYVRISYAQKAFSTSLAGKDEAGFQRAVGDFIVSASSFPPAGPAHTARRAHALEPTPAVQQGRARCHRVTVPGALCWPRHRWFSRPRRRQVIICVAAPFFSFTLWVEDRMVLAWRAYLTTLFLNGYFQDHTYFRIK